MSQDMIPHLPMTSSGLPDALGAANSYRDALLTTHDTVRISNEIAQQRSLDAPIRALGSMIIGDITNAKTQIPERVANWIRKNVKYTQETPMVEVLQGPYRTLGGDIKVNTPMGPFAFRGTGTGDCDDLSILFATLCRSLGLEAHLVGVAKIGTPDNFFHAMGYYNGVFYELSKDKPYGGVNGNDSKVASEVPYDGIIGLIYDPIRKSFSRVHPSKKHTKAGGGMSGNTSTGYDPITGGTFSSMRATDPATPAATPAAPAKPEPRKTGPDRPIDVQSICGDPLDSLQPRYTVPLNLYAPSRQISGISMNGSSSMGVGEGLGMGIRPVSCGCDHGDAMSASDPTPAAETTTFKHFGLYIRAKAPGSLVAGFTIRGMAQRAEDNTKFQLKAGEEAPLAQHFKCMSVSELKQIDGTFTFTFQNYNNKNTYSYILDTAALANGGIFSVVCHDSGIYLDRAPVDPQSSAIPQTHRVTHLPVRKPQEARDLYHPSGSDPYRSKEQDPYSGKMHATLRFSSKQPCTVKVLVRGVAKVFGVTPGRNSDFKINIYKPGKDQIIVSGRCKSAGFGMINIPISSLVEGEILDFVLIPNQPPYLSRRVRPRPPARPPVGPPRQQHDYHEPPKRKGPDYVLIGEIPAPTPLVGFDDKGYVLVDITEPLMLFDKQKGLNHPWPRDSRGRIWAYFSSADLKHFRIEDIGMIKFGTPAAYANDVEQKMRLLPIKKERWPEALRESVKKDAAHIKAAFADKQNSPIDPVFLNPSLAYLMGVSLYWELADLGAPYGAQLVVVQPTTPDQPPIVAVQPPVSLPPPPVVVSLPPPPPEQTPPPEQPQIVLVSQPPAEQPPQIVVSLPPPPAEQPTVAAEPPAEAALETTKAEEPAQPEQKKGGGGGLLALAAAAAGVYLLTRG